MNYQQFVLVIKDKIAQHLEDGIDLKIHTTLKNNGVERVGLTITDEHIPLSPTIYLEEHYKQYKNEISIQDIVNNILNVYHEVKSEHSWEVHTVKDYKLMRSKIVYKLIHAKKNEALLKNIPYIAYLDFAIVFYILFEVDESGTATIPITHELIQLWGVSLDDVQQNAFCNAPILLPAHFKPMQVVINELIGAPCCREDTSEDLMFVLTNSIRNFGASCILYDGMLDHISKQVNGNFYVLPSSIHEMIIIPERNSPMREHLNEMIAEVNQTQVDEEEFLSDYVYYYDSEIKTLS